MSLPGVIAEEPARTCEECGAFEETRPYGIGGKRICYNCGVKDRVGTTQRMSVYLFGEELTPEEAEEASRDVGP